MLEFIRSHKRFFYLLLITVVTGIVIAVGCNKGGGNDIIEPQPPAEETPGTSPSRIENGLRENTIPVGLSTFPLGVNNKFPLEDNQQAEEIGYKVVARSVRKIATNELYTFPERSSQPPAGATPDQIRSTYSHTSPDAVQVRETVKFFLNNGHEVLHQIHIINGPGLRGGDEAFSNSILGNNTRPNKYINNMFNNQQLQEGLLTLFDEVVKHAKLLEEMGATVYICPELEDNHETQYGGSNNSYQIYLDFLRHVGWSNSDGSLRADRVVKNGVTDGGGIGSIPGIRYERHPRSVQGMFGLRPGDFANMDGVSLYLNSDEDKPGYLVSEDEVRRMLQFAEDNQIVFYVWPSELQGLRQTGQPGSYSIVGSLRDRAYILRKPKEFISILMKLSPEQVQVN